MRRSPGITWRAGAGTIAMLLPLAALSACSGRDDQMAERLAAAEAAAEKAIVAQRAAEKAAALALTSRSEPASEPVIVSDTDTENGLENEEENGVDASDEEFSMGGEGQTITPDGVVVPGQGV